MAERVTVTEIECDYSCSWETALQAYKDSVGRQNFACFGVEKDANGRASQRREGESKVYLFSGHQ